MMKTYPVPQAIQITLHPLSLIRHALLFMLLSLLTLSVFANKELPAPTALPCSFSAVVQQQKAVLQWSVNNEQGISHYTVERSINGHDYTDIATVFTGEGSSQVQQYNFRDNLPKAAGVVFYRLKIVHADGSAGYSAVKEIKSAPLLPVALYEASPALVIPIPSVWKNKRIGIHSIHQNGQTLKALMINNTSSVQNTVYP